LNAWEKKLGRGVSPPGSGKRGWATQSNRRLRKGSIKEGDAWQELG